MKRGFTLHELIISLSVMSGVMLIAGHFATHQTRVLRSTREAQLARSQLGEVTGIGASLLANLKPGAGDIVVAEDSVLEVRLTTGTSVHCGGTVGQALIPRVDSTFYSLSSFFSPPQAGDRLDAFIADTTGSTWTSFLIVAVGVIGMPCPAFPGSEAALLLMLDQPLSLPAGVALRFTRPFRLSHYRSSDGRWYLGGRDWNGNDQRFNTVQPLAGPLASRDPHVPGLVFEYRDARHAVLPSPVDTRQVRTITIVVRTAAAAGGARDSTVLVAALRQ